MVSLLHSDGRSGLPELRSYEYLLAMSYQQWAWEGLRRNTNYVVATRQVGSIRSWRLPGAPNVLVSRDRVVSPLAREFALCSFR